MKSPMIQFDNQINCFDMENCTRTLAETTKQFIVDIDNNICSDARNHLLVGINIDLEILLSHFRGI